MSVALERRADLNRSNVARYIQLATLFRRRIESGYWPVGSQIPTIEELIEECGVARATIRQAIGLLEAEGLVSRFRAKGTFVTAKAPDQLLVEVTTDWHGLVNAKADATIEVLEDETGGAPPMRPHDIGIVAPDYRRLRRRHSRAGQAYLVAEVYIDARLAAKLPADIFTNTTAMRLASSIPGVKIVEAHQTMTVGSADMDVAELLNLPLNAPVCYIDRSAVDQRGRLVMVSKGIYRGDVVRMDMKLK